MAKQNSVITALITGAAGAAAITAALAAFGKAQDNDSWAPINAISHMVFGDKAANVDGFQPKETLTGLSLNTGAIGVWSAIYEKAAGGVPFPQSLATGALTSAAAYVLDYHIIPPRLRPGFEKRTDNNAIVATYALLALTLGLSPLVKSAVRKTTGSGGASD